uniref:F-box domain-containing protein n=3 Tax=Aegilops tauschii subsp. strangulata TaxID=200361 RepID=A0A453T715_AEGTS
PTCYHNSRVSASLPSEQGEIRASMEASSVPRQSSTQEPDGPCDGADRISALPDDLLLDVLARLPCAGAAARTGVLSRRWSGLWARLRQIVFRDVPFPSLEAALVRIPTPPPAVSLIEIRVPPKQRLRGESAFPKPNQNQDRAGSAVVKSLLRAVARLAPEKLVFRLPSYLIGRHRLPIDLPRFDGATSIALDFPSPFSLRVPAGANFPALEALSLTYCITDLDAWLSCCPRLRKLRLCRALFPNHKCDIRVNSPSLQELVVYRELSLTQHVDVVAPALKELTLSFSTKKLISISVLAPLVEKVSWHCCYSGSYIVFGLWGINKLQLQTAERQGQLSSLQIHAYADTSFLHAEAGNFAQEIEKHMVAAFSVLELHLTAKGHAFAGFVFHLLGMDRVGCGTQSLKVILRKSAMKGGCSPLCPCEFPNWKPQIICLAALEEVEFNGFEGEDHEFDLLKLILGCAPMLKRMIVKLSQETSASNDGCTKIYNIFEACSSVECDVYGNSGLMLGCFN